MNDALDTQPSNTTYGVTRADGTGAAKFVVWTKRTNASLGCSTTVACSLVVVPIEGISCDVAASGLPAADRPVGNDAVEGGAACTKVGQTVTRGDLSVEGLLWWSASNWRNRITVPLSFKPEPVDCALSGGKAAVQFFGSELLGQATSSWVSKACVDPSLSPFKHIQTGEPQARNLLSTGTIPAAFTSDPPDAPYPVPVVNAPVAFSGFVIGYTIDGADGRDYQNLRLTPRLLAKLLTESYSTGTLIENDHLPNAPFDLTYDPEFIALNPGIAQSIGGSDAASTLFTLSSDSDVVYALTSYINADKDARDWLDGKPDPWGMTVNPAYWKIALPVNQWPLLDTYEKPAASLGQNLCLLSNPVPYLPLVAAPTSRMFTISLGLQYSLPQSTTVCQPGPNGGGGPDDGAKLVAGNRQVPGHRFMLGITSWGDAVRFQIDMAALQTRVTDSAPTKFTNADGRTFVAPSDSSLRASAALLKFDKDSGTWPIPYSALVGPDAPSGAYPGAMVVYAAVPLQGLNKTDAANYASVLRFMATTGQTTGSGQGQLPPGYVPLTASNHLGALSSYSVQMADQVQAQTPVQTSQDGSSDGSDSFNGTDGPPATSSDASNNAAARGDQKKIENPALSTTSGEASATASRAAGVLGLALPLLLVVLLLGLFAYPALGISAKRRLR